MGPHQELINAPVAVGAYRCDACLKASSRSLCALFSQVDCPELDGTENA